MAKSNEPGQAGTYDPKKGGKFKPTTKAKPPGNPHEGHGHKGTPQKP